MYRYQNEHERHICEQVWELATRSAYRYVRRGELYYIPEDFRELLRMACDSVWEQGELYSEDLLLAAFKPAIDEHDRQIAEQAWENGYIQALKNMNPMPGEEPPEYTPNPYRKENA
jgi:hypothetical protein